MNYERYLTYVVLKGRPCFWSVAVPIPSHGIKRSVYEKLGDFVDKEKAMSVVREYFKGCTKDSKGARELALRLRVKALESECEMWREKALEWRREGELLEVM